MIKKIKQIRNIIRIMKIGTGAKDLNELEKMITDFYKSMGVI